MDADERELREAWENSDPAYWSAAATWAKIKRSLTPTYSMAEVIAKLRRDK